MINSTSPRCHKPMRIHEKPGNPHIPDVDPPRLCGRPENHNPPCRWEKLVEQDYRAAAARAAARRARTGPQELAHGPAYCPARPGYLPVTGVAWLAGVTRQSVFRAIGTRRLPAERKGGQWWVTPADGQRYASQVAAFRKAAA